MEGMRKTAQHVTSNDRQKMHEKLRKESIKTISLDPQKEKAIYSFFDSLAIKPNECLKITITKIAAKQVNLSLNREEKRYFSFAKIFICNHFDIVFPIFGGLNKITVNRCGKKIQDY